MKTIKEEKWDFIAWQMLFELLYCHCSLLFINADQVCIQFDFLLSLEVIMICHYQPLLNQENVMMHINI